MVELMVASTVGLILLSGVVQIFLSNRQNYRLTENIARIQEGGRFASGLIAKDLRMAGFSGCAASLEKPNILINGGAKNNSANGYSTFREGGLRVLSSDTLPNDLPAAMLKTAKSTHQIVAGTHLLDIQRAIEPGFKLIAGMKNRYSPISLSKEDMATIQDFSVFIISDCNDIDLFAMKSHVTMDLPAANAGIRHIGVTRAYQEDARIYPYRRVIYYIAYKDTPNNTPSLYRWDNQQPDSPQELVADVEDLQVLLTERKEGLSVIVPPKRVTDYSSVVSANVAFLLRSHEPNLRAADQSITYNGKSVHYASNDTHMRTVFSRTIAIRNR